MEDAAESSQWSKQLLVIATCLGILGVNIWLSWLTCDWSWISRSGTLIVVAGILLEGWLVLKTPRYGDMPFWNSQAGHTAVRVGIVIVCLGTLIQGYGDHISILFSSCPEIQSRHDSLTSRIFMSRRTMSRLITSRSSSNA